MVLPYKTNSHNNKIPNLIETEIDNDKTINRSFHLHLFILSYYRKNKKFEMKKQFIKDNYDLFNSFDFFTLGYFLSSFGFVSLNDL